MSISKSSSAAALAKNVHAIANYILAIILLLLLLLLTTFLVNAQAANDNEQNNFYKREQNFENAKQQQQRQQQQQQQQQQEQQYTNLDGNYNGSKVLLRRGKRYLDFTKGSRMSWRATAKNNLITVNTLWAYGFGFRANFPFVDKEDRIRPFFKRDVMHALQDTLDGHGFDGRACLLKSFCTAAFDVNVAQKSGMLFKLLKMIFSLDEHDKRHLPYLRTENCQQLLHSHCPLSFDSISPYTDDV